MSIKFLQDGKIDETALDFEERLCVAAIRLQNGYWDEYLGEEPFYLRDDSLHEIIPYKSIIAKNLVSIIGEQRFDMIQWKLHRIGTEQEWVKGHIYQALSESLLWGRRGRSMKKIKNPVHNASPVLDKNTEDKRYKRYKYICYRNLIFKGLLFFALGILCAYLLQF